MRLPNHSLSLMGMLTACALVACVGMACAAARKAFGLPTYLVEFAKVDFSVPPGIESSNTVDQKVVILIEGAGVDYYSSARTDFSAALQRVGFRVNDHSAAEQIKVLLPEIGANSEEFNTRLDQLGVDTLLILDVGDMRLTHNGNSGQGGCPFNAEFVMTIRSISPRSVELIFSGSAQLTGTARSEAEAREVTREVIELASQRLAEVLSPEPAPAE